jgi:N4-gp56 family major capsid protein
MGMATGQVWATSSLGGYLYSDNLSKVLRYSVQPLVKFRQFADVKDAALQEKKKGEAFHWDIFSDVATSGTTLTETTTMPETNFTITQGTMTIAEAGNSVPYSGKLDDLSLLPVKEIIQKVMKNDCKKYFDRQAYAQFDKTLLRVVPTAGTNTSALDLTTNGTATTTNNVAMGKEHVKTIVDLMKERNIPPYLMDDYIAISHPSTLRKFKNDLEAVKQYTETGFGLIMNGECGRYESTRFVEQTNIPKGGAANKTTFNPFTNTAQAWSNAQSSWAFFFGDDTVAEGIVIPEEMRGRIPGDFGRSRGIAWYYLGNFALVHYLDAVQTRVVKWDSAA